MCSTAEGVQYGSGTSSVGRRVRSLGLSKLLRGMLETVFIWENDLL